MQSKFAKAIAANLRLIAQNSALVALMNCRAIPENAETRAKACRDIEKAEQNIAALLMCPGAQFEPVKVWTCPECGRRFEGGDVPKDNKCPSDNCPSHGKRG